MTRQSMEDQFADWTDKWEKAQAEGIFADAPKPAQPRHQNSPDFFGQYPTPSGKNFNNIDAEYWKQVYSMSSGAGDAPDVADDNDEFQDGSDHTLNDHKRTKGKKLNETKKKLKEADEYGPGFTPVKNPKGVVPPSVQKGSPVTSPEYRKDLGERAAALGRSPNPIYYYSQGPDSQPKVTPNWAGGEQVEKIIELRRELGKLEAKINALEGTGKVNNKSLESQMQSLRTKLDTLSDQLAPGMLEDPLS